MYGKSIKPRLDQIFAQGILTSCRAPITISYWDPSSKNNNYVPDTIVGFPNGAVVKNLPANAGDVGSVLRLGRSPGEGNGNPLQDSWLGNPMDRGAWRATVHGVAKESDMTEQLNHKQDTTLWGLCIFPIPTITLQDSHYLYFIEQETKAQWCWVHYERSSI